MFGAARGAKANSDPVRSQGAGCGSRPMVSAGTEVLQDAPITATSIPFR